MINVSEATKNAKTPEEAVFNALKQMGLYELESFIKVCRAELKTNPDNNNYIQITEFAEAAVSENKKNSSEDTDSIDTAIREALGYIEENGSPEGDEEETRESGDSLYNTLSKLLGDCKNTLD